MVILCRMRHTCIYTDIMTRLVLRNRLVMDTDRFYNMNEMSTHKLSRIESSASSNHSELSHLFFITCAGRNSVVKGVDFIHCLFPSLSVARGTTGRFERALASRRLVV